jgi:hypothetical protein
MITGLGPFRVRWRPKEIAMSEAAFPQELNTLRVLLDGDGELAERLDTWVYEAFNSSYKPSDWTRNPCSDESLLTFAKDGVGGQVVLWRRGNQSELSLCPVCFLGRDGEVAVVAQSLREFGELLAHGVAPYSVAANELPDSGVRVERVAGWLQEQFGVEPRPNFREILSSAAELLPEFRSLVEEHRARRAVSQTQSKKKSKRR